MAFQSAQKLKEHYPWTSSPLIVSAPMRLLAGPALTHAVSSAGGLGFLGAGIPGRDFNGPKLVSLIEKTAALFTEAWYVEKGVKDMPYYPFGVGFLLIDVDTEKLEMVREALKSLPKPVAAIWLFPAADMNTLSSWHGMIYDAGTIANGKVPTKSWYQVGTVAQGTEVLMNCCVDTLVVQGADAGGHGLAASASIISLLPEMGDALSTIDDEHFRKQDSGSIPLIAAGGISDGRSVAAATMLGASGVVLGTRFLATPECIITPGYQAAVLAAHDGGVSTVRTSVYDTLRGTPWPEKFNGRAIKNKSWHDAQETGGEVTEELKKKFDEAMKMGDNAWGVEGRATTYAGSGVGLVREVRPAGEVVREVREKAKRIIKEYAMNGLATEGN